MFTVKELLDLDLLPWYQVLSGEQRIETAPIEYISVIELPVGDFIRENELVLSTALGCEEHPDLMFELVHDVHKAKACALLIAVQSDHICLPQKVKAYLKQHDFPLILIPWQSRFADITEVVIQYIRNDTVTETSFYETVQKQLLSAYLDNSGARNAAEILAENFKSDVIIFDTEGNPKTSNRPLNDLEYEPIPPAEKQGTYYMEIKSAERLYGSVYLIPNANSTVFNHMLFQRYLVWLLILWFDKEWVIESTRQNAKDDFIWKLTREPTENREDLAAKANFLGLQLNESYLCIVGKIHLNNTDSVKQTDKWIQSNLGRLKEQLTETAGLMGRQMMVTYQRKLLVIYLQSNMGEQVSSCADRFLDKLEKKAEAAFSQLRFTWGISNGGGEPTNFRECFLDAKLALELCLNSTSTTNRFAFKNTIIYKALSILAADEAIKAKTLRIINPLVEYDHQNDSNLIKTLKIYLDSRNVSEAARSLHLHRQSLLYRLNKIEELSGLSLKNADDLFLLELCIRLFSDMPNQ